ncbi:protein LTO1 homolog isoform X2 [Bombina bombina]|uniref:protein LTO1 homolog isoform X2 n=1 Tax=Bombina bombina TaxID=8345 RepID=UPI00235A5614|nr:protein LTO1 homolog isoform X2 [Bombina bombina]
MASAEDLFEGIVMCEERFRGEGYLDGFAEGNHVGESEGKQYGTIYGSRVGSELGCFLGFATTWRQLLTHSSEEKHSKKIKALDSLIRMIEDFSCDDPTNDKLQESMTRIYGKVKQVCSMLNIQPDIIISNNGAGLSF